MLSTTFNFDGLILGHEESKHGEKWNLLYTVVCEIFAGDICLMLSHNGTKTQGKIRLLQLHYASQVGLKINVANTKLLLIKRRNCNLVGHTLKRSADSIALQSLDWNKSKRRRSVVAEATALLKKLLKVSGDSTRLKVLKVGYQKDAGNVKFRKFWMESDLSITRKAEINCLRNFREEATCDCERGVRNSNALRE